MVSSGSPLLFIAEGTLPGVLVVLLWGFKSSRIRFLDFFNDPRIIREQRISAYKGYRGGGMEVMCGSYEIRCRGLGSSFDVLDGVGRCHGYFGLKWSHVFSFLANEVLEQVIWVRALDIQVMLHDKRIVMQVTLHYEFKQTCPRKRDIPLDSVEVLRYEKRSRSEIKGKVPTEMELLVEQIQQEHQSDKNVITMKMEHLLEPTSNKLSKDSILQARNPVKEILLKLNLPDHRSILMDSNVTPTKHRRMTKPYSSLCFIANCFNAGYLKIEVKVPNSSCLKDS
nr:hypothetical protein [Tanacetum cinerariifolium]